MNKLYFGDNLEVMRDLPDKSVDLIATDPPFNSGRDYNIFLKDSLAQNKAFTDIWRWDEIAKETRRWIEDQDSDTYRALNRVLEGYDLVFDYAVQGPQARMRSYLSFIGPRLVEMHRLLKDTGSIYLHCDSTASHYLKGLLDAIFGSGNFRNEIVWSYHRFSRSAKYQFPRMNDIIFFYSKSEDKNIFHKQYTKHKSSAHLEKGYHTVGDNGVKKLLVYNMEKAKKANVDFSNYDQVVETKAKQPLLGQIWSDINFLSPRSKERFGYPTQKPIKLYKRIIKASSNPGGTVLDPFCGCGTTIDAAQELGRNWIGIDITHLALTPIEERLWDNHRISKGKDFQVLGYPTNMQEVLKLKEEKKYHDLANWAVAQLGLKATKDIGDGGIDGIGTISTWIPQGMAYEKKRIVAEVKTGNISKAQVRSFCQSMTDENALIGIMVSLNKPTKAMLEYQERLGRFEHNGKKYNRFQFWQIDDRYFENPESKNQQIHLPWVIEKTMKENRI